MSVVALSLGCARGVRLDSAVAGMKPATGKVYSNEAGEQVTIIPLEPHDSKKALVEFNGTKSELDGKVVIASVDRDRGTGYWTKWRGRTQRFVTVHDRGGFEDLILSPAGASGYTHLKPDTGRTAALKVEKVFARYEEAEEDGDLKPFLDFDRKFWTDQAEKELGEKLAEANKACGSKMATTIAWDTIPDPILNKLSIPSYCAGPLESLQQLCSRSEEAKRTVQQKVQTVECRVDAKAAVTLEAQKVIWSVTDGDLIQAEATTTYFTDNL
ncbi:hypothetical protein OV207_04845 [Corallococcus sp. BB11-1]|uniref:hypothetical protein n=1 Tax=Corallococcus sp. BB11-1 TaxID=2996783 RepID=UPI0022708150|nr:hypothetical protein [Corallococcus sp. BB11-1]MCY1030774.1 hypothetical protein [Corallococcus sp. BB11-1]